MRGRIFIGCALAWLAVARAGGGVIYEAAGTGFTLEAPEGWSVKKDPIEPLPVLAGPADDPQAPLVIVTEMTAGRDLFDLGDATVRELVRDPSHQLAARDAFLTADRQPGLKYVIKTLTPAGPYRQVFYFVPGPGPRRFNILATVSEERWEKYNVSLDNIARTFRLTGGAPASAYQGAAAPPAAPAKTPSQSAARRGGK